MNELFIALIGLVSGATGQYIISTFKMPKKEEKDADKQFIDTLIERVSHLEGRLDEVSKQLTNVMTENAMLKVEMDFLKRENEELKKEQE